MSNLRMFQGVLLRHPPNLEYNALSHPRFANMRTVAFGWAAHFHFVDARLSLYFKTRNYAHVSAKKLEQ